MPNKITQFYYNQNATYARYLIYTLKTFMMRHILLTLFLPFACYAATAQMELSLSDAIELMYENNSSLKAAAQNIGATEYERRAVRGLRFPSVDITANYTLLQRDINIDLGGAKGIISQSANNLINNGLSSGILTPDLAKLITDGISPITSIPWSYPLQKRSLGVVAANLTLPIYAGGRIKAANDAADIELRISEYEYLALKNSLLSELVKRYYGVVIQQEVVKVRGEVHSAIRQHLYDIEAMEEEGIVAHSAVLFVRYKLAEAERDFESAQMNLTIAERALQTILSIDIPIKTTEKMFIGNNMYNAHYYISNANHMNPIISIANLEKRLAEVGSKVSRADFLPEVAIIGSGVIGSHQLSDMIPRWAVGIGVNLRLFDGLSSQNRYYSSRLMEQAANNAVESTRDNIRLLVEKEYYTLIDSHSAIISSQSLIEYAESYLTTAIEGFREGITTSSDLIDAQVELAAAKLRYADAAYNYCIALAKLLEATGMSYEFINIAQSGSPIEI